jgi:hypothetical protein
MMLEEETPNPKKRGGRGEEKKRSEKRLGGREKGREEKRDRGVTGT